MDGISYKLEVFEGPLDLLLHLISKHKLNINDIPIFELVEQYTEYVRQMQEENLVLASDFLEMAARLVHIKTLSLLPKHEEAEELKRELTGELLEYRDCKLIAAKLAAKTEGFEKMVKSAERLSFAPEEYRRFHDSSELFRAYMNAVGKRLRRLPPPVTAFAGIVSRRIVSVNSKIQELMSRMSLGKKRRFSQLLSEAETRSDLVATFLAVLELCKSKIVRIDGEGADTEITLISEKAEVKELEFE